MSDQHPSQFVKPVFANPAYTGNAANYYFGSPPASVNGSRQRSAVSGYSGFKTFVPTGPNDPRYPPQMRPGFYPPTEACSYSPSVQEQQAQVMNQNMKIQIDQNEMLRKSMEGFQQQIAHMSNRKMMTLTCMDPKR